MNSAQTTSDILTTIAAKKDATAKRITRHVKRYQVMYSGKGSRKVYTRIAATRLASRAKRLGLDCYISPLMVNA